MSNTLLGKMQQRDEMIHLYTKFKESVQRYKDTCQNYRAAKEFHGPKSQQAMDAKSKRDAAKKIKAEASDNAKAASAKSKGKINKLQKEINASIREKEQRLKEWMEEKGKEAKKQSKEEDKTGHALNTAQINAILLKDSRYNKSASEYLGEDPKTHCKNMPLGGVRERIDTTTPFNEHKKKGVYADYPFIKEAVDFLKLTAPVPEVKKKYGYPTKEEDIPPTWTAHPNFNPRAYYKAPNGDKIYAGQQYPYEWEAHHMLPLNAFYLEFDGGEPVFTGTTFSLLMICNYDINNGNNMIMLPSLETGSIIHHLLQHPSDHKAYNRQVQMRLRLISERFQKITDQVKTDHPAIKELETGLHNAEDRFWKLIVGLSRKLAQELLKNEKINLTPEEIEIHKKQSAGESATKYPLGALA